ncbi:MAG: hypothetical protein QXS25_05720 [Candidatus Nitrosocaldus sp.]
MGIIDDAKYAMNRMKERDDERSGMRGEISMNRDDGRDGYYPSNGRNGDGNAEYAKNLDEGEVEKRINAIVIKHLSSVLGEHTLKVINYHFNRMGVDIYNLCSDPKKVEDAFFALFKDGSRMLISDIINTLYAEFNVQWNGDDNGKDRKQQSLDDAIKLVKASIISK